MDNRTFLVIKKKKKKIFSFVAIWTELEDIMLREVSQAKKHKFYMFSFLEGKKKNLIEVN